MPRYWISDDSGPTSRFRPDEPSWVYSDNLFLGHKSETPKQTTLKDPVYIDNPIGRDLRESWLTSMGYWGGRIHATLDMRFDPEQ